MKMLMVGIIVGALLNHTGMYLAEVYADINQRAGIHLNGQAPEIKPLYDFNSHGD